MIQTAGALNTTFTRQTACQRPFVPIWEVPLPRCNEEAASADRLEAGILPRGEINLGLWRPPEGIKRLPRPWEKASHDANHGVAPAYGSGVRRDRKVSTTPPACRPKMGGRAMWRRLAEPRRPWAPAKAIGTPLASAPASSRGRPGKAALRYQEAEAASRGTARSVTPAGVNEEA
eukprot:s614_g10.t1